MRCKICGSPSEEAFRAKVLGKYDVRYLVCSGCGFMQTEEPFWLSESYGTAINDVDLGPVQRAITSAGVVEGLILSCFDFRAKFIDYGGGYGLFVRLMRDRGFDFYWYDRYCENLFAKTFVAKEEGSFELLTAFEVFEHLVDPLAEIEKMLQYSGTIVFSTLLLPESAKSNPDWWYFGPDHGQHIAFYTLPALRAVAERFGLQLYSDGMNTH